MVPRHQNGGVRQNQGASATSGCPTPTAGRDWINAWLLAGEEAREAQAWLDAHTQEGHAGDQWMGELYEWAGADPARRAQAREMVIADLRQWVQSAVDMGQRNRYVRLYAETL